MNISEKPLDEETLQAIRDYAHEAAERLHVDLQETPPEEIVAAIDRHIIELQRAQIAKEDPVNSADEEHPENEESALLLASLWGEQVARRLGWQWATVIFHDHDDAELIGICSPDRALAIYPYQFVFSCLEERTVVTVALAFNILVDGRRVPKLPSGGYENVMDNVHHVVPPQ